MPGVLRTLLRIVIVTSVLALFFFALWFALAVFAVFLVGNLIYSKLTGKSFFRRYTRGNTTIINVSNWEWKEEKPLLIEDQKWEEK